MCLVIGLKPVTRKSYFFLYLEPSGLKSELTVILLRRVSRRDKVVIYQDRMFFFFFYIPINPKLFKFQINI